MFPRTTIVVDFSMNTLNFCRKCDIPIHDVGHVGIQNDDFVFVGRVESGNMITSLSRADRSLVVLGYSDVKRRMH